MREQIISSVGKLFNVSIFNISSLVHLNWKKKNVLMRFRFKIPYNFSYSWEIKLRSLSTKSAQNVQNVVYLLLS